ncbi:MAG: glycosyl hydrolase, partial [Ruminococcus sp.]|nr:glycosyl hydrolase [Ruminococcus sp.]
MMKKLISSALACGITLSMLPFSSSDNSRNIKQIFSDLQISAEPMNVSAANSNFRRPLSNDSPMWIVHIDSWNYPDPEKIIDLVPEDILPYVVFNISLSINWSSTEHKWLMVQDGIETARSWIKACADKGVWTMIQPASGGQSHFPDYPADYDLDNTIFGEFFRDYPNFIGYNYCEQFWGFASQDFPVTYQQRYDHFAALLKLCNKYGGYLDVSWCENPWGSNLNPVAMLKTNKNWENACRTYKDNFILEEKYTQTSYIADVESECFGAYVSGYCGNWGVRWDDTGWSDYPWNGGILDQQTHDQYRLSTSLPILFERMAMNGMTVIDGPELVWNDCIQGLWDGTDSEGYKYRRWDFYNQCKNVNIDLMRKFMDGTIRIPDRKEVIDRTKVVIIQDVNSGKNDDKYCT